MFGNRPLVPGAGDGPLSSWKALEEYLDKPEFTPGIDEAWRLWKKRAFRFVLGTAALTALAFGSAFLVRFYAAAAYAAMYFGGLALAAIIALPFYTLYEWAVTRERIENWHKRQAGEPKEARDEEPEEELRWLYIGDRKR